MMLPLSKALTKLLRKLDVEIAILCSGSRNKFLIQSLADELKTYETFDERSAGFFSLGINKRSGCLKSIVCVTSGTAVSELLPSVIEAYYTGVPMLVISTDLPSKYEGVFYPQKINQVNLFGSFASQLHLDLSNNQREITLIFDQSKPNNWNICFEEIDPTVNYESVRLELYKSEKEINLPKQEVVCDAPIAIVSQLDDKWVSSVAEFITKWKIPTLVDPFNLVSTKLSLRPFSISEKVASQMNFKTILLFGKTPSFRLWRDFFRTSKFRETKVLAFPQRCFEGIHERHDFVMHFSYDVLQDLECRNVESIWPSFLSHGFNSFSEPSILKKLLESYPGHTFFVGNSSPAYSLHFLEHFDHEILGNRGCNGVDGLVSTFAGITLAQGEQPTIGVIGDLSFLYDIQGLWFLKKISDLSWKLFVLNNVGGRIFEYLGISEKVSDQAKKILATEQTTNIENLVKAFDLDYLKLNSDSNFTLLPQATIYEIEIDPSISKFSWHTVLNS
ncbi:MAG: thiamine pyrophosphate-binding protein [Deltaproteobacteria bacterium]|nr:thiamine pyrophosphate-binding protein [Deltaproteobacteria bacterium]